MSKFEETANAPLAGEPWTTVVFSLTNGFVWVAWPGASGAVKLGEYEPVRAMMQDFLDQSTLGERLGSKARAPSSPTVSLGRPSK